MYHQFEISVKSTGSVIRSIHAYGDTRAEARKDAVKTFRKQYDSDSVELAR